MKLYYVIYDVDWNGSVTVNDNTNVAVLCSAKSIWRREKIRCDNEEYWFKGKMMKSTCR